jgi:hypothetical protein
VTSRNPATNIHALRDQCEQEIDRTTLGEFLETVVMEICFTKAEHTRALGFEATAQRWDLIAQKINVMIAHPIFSLT